jgi:hypothetical protein
MGRLGGAAENTLLVLTVMIHIFQTNKQAGNIVLGVESFISKPAMKPTLGDIQEVKEGEMKRLREKEEEVIKKRELRVKAKVEEKRR